MKKIIVMGTQWGDEGKGKIVNYFSNPYFFGLDMCRGGQDWVVRFSGGANAGHTVILNTEPNKNITYVNHILPSVNIHSDTRVFLGSGMVLDLEQLYNEICNIRKFDSNFGSKVYVDLEAFLVITPWNKEEESIMESKNPNPIVTTKKGIGPAYADKINRYGIKVCHLFNKLELIERLHVLYDDKVYKYGETAITKLPTFVGSSLRTTLNKLLDMGVKFVSSMGLFKKEDNIIFEGSQGALLDIDFGTYPFVTSSSCLPYAIESCGVSLSDINEIYGVAKLYNTRVGAGPFPTEDKGYKILDTFDESYSWRIGQFDLAALNYVCKKAKITSLILTKADIVSKSNIGNNVGFKPNHVAVCKKYNVNGDIIDFPRTTEDFSKATPGYEFFPTWHHIDDYNFTNLLHCITNTTDVNVSYISYGPKTQQLIHVTKLQNKHKYWRT